MYSTEAAPRSNNGAAVLEVVTGKKVPALPIVPASNALHEFLVYDDSMLPLSFQLDIQLTDLAAKEKARRKLMKERTGGKHEYLR